MALTDGLIAKYEFDSDLTDDAGSYDLVAYSGANVSGVELDLSYGTTEAVRSDFTVEKSVTVTAPAGTDTTNINVEITK